MPDETKMDEIVRLLEDLLILQGLKMKMSLDDVRALVGVDKKRVNRVSQLIKKAKQV